MPWLLDTNVLSELRRPERTDSRVAAWADSVFAAELHLSVVTIMEIDLGAALIERRDATQGASLRNWIDGQVLPAFSGRILPIDLAVARRCARLHAPDPQSERDALIAATALEHGLTVVTRNVRDFETMGAPILNPWLTR